jgi:hypothetical protein
MFTVLRYRPTGSSSLNGSPRPLVQQTAASIIASSVALSRRNQSGASVWSPPVGQSVSAFGGLARTPSRRGPETSPEREGPELEAPAGPEWLIGRKEIVAVGSFPVG